MKRAKETSDSFSFSKAPKLNQSMPLKSTSTSTPLGLGGDEMSKNESFGGKLKKGKSIKKDSFKRIKSNTEGLPTELADNSYRPESHNDFGVRAQQSFSKVKGKQFKHEKTKKKRGSYTGGIISTNVKSFKFED